MLTSVMANVLFVGEGSIIITTKSGGTGSSVVTFKGIQITQILPTQSSAVFVDETHTFLTSFDKHRWVDTVMLVSLYSDPGFLITHNGLLVFDKVTYHI